MNFTDEEAKYYYEELLKNDIRVWSIGSPLGKVDIDVDFEEYKNTVLKRLCELANIFQTSRIRMFSFFKAYEKKDEVIKKLQEMVNFAKKYNVEFYKKDTPGNSIDRIRLNGFNNGDYSQHINASIKREIKSRRCVVLGTSNPEVDHKNGMKNEARVMKNEAQRLSDFQALSKAANDAKRQFCKECMRTGIRYDAKQLGYPMSYYKGGAKHNNEENACIGCYWYDPIEFRRHLQEKK